MQPSTDSEKSRDSSKQQQFKCKVRENQEVGRWKKSEHDDFIKGLKMYGKDWKKIEALVKTRNGAQIRSHAQKWFSKINKLNKTSTLEGDHIKEEELETLKLLNERSKKREIKQMLKEAESEVQPELEPEIPFKPVEGIDLSKNRPDPHHVKKYSDEDILLLIKFIVKEFSKVVHKWFYSQPSSLLGANLPAQQANNNQLLLHLLLNRENTMRQQQESLNHALLQQTNSKLLLDMISQFKLNQGAPAPSSPIGVGTFTHRGDEPKENFDDIKTPEGDNPEGKDDVNTVQSSEGRTDRKESISEDHKSNKISLSEAYSILNKNAHLQSLFQNISSFK
ncbi:unnamed protein product [Moneuplotes crassus]|uniref:Uncharacterized protein n=1 Tax=Euplotes crassus TaxID=5936 RepID=A0AAD1Y6Z8_EUPCR|nr:unnamed protein product [Moneuplotes crassus]